MSNAWWTLAGALVGAGGLMAAALSDQKESREKNLSQIGSGDVAALVRSLNSYYFKASIIDSKCNQLVVKSMDLTLPPLETGDEGFLTRTGNAIGNGLTQACRNMNYSSMLTLKKEASELFRKYKNAFVKANEVLETHGVQPASLKGLSFAGVDLSLDKSLANDSWEQDFNELSSKICDFLEKTQNIANQLVENLEGLKSRPCALPA